MRNIYTNDLSKKRLSENHCIVSDFDGTITTFNSASSIGVFRDIFGKNYCDELNDEMKRLKADITISSLEKTRSFAIFELCLLSDYLKKGIDLSELYGLFEIREDFKYLLDFLSNEGKRIFINSSGVGNVIEYILKRSNLYSDNIEITSNFYDNNSQFDCSSLIYSKMKYNPLFLSKMECFDSKILVGNSVSDINMLPPSYRNENNIYVGILDNCEKTMEYMDFFDIISLNNDIWPPVKKALSINKTERRG